MVCVGKKGFVGRTTIWRTLVVLLILAAIWVTAHAWMTHTALMSGSVPLVADQIGPRPPGQTVITRT